MAYYLLTEAHNILSAGITVFLLTVANNVLTGAHNMIELH